MFYQRILPIKKIKSQLLLSITDKNTCYKNPQIILNTYNYTFSVLNSFMHLRAYGF